MNRHGASRILLAAGVALMLGVGTGARAQESNAVNAPPAAEQGAAGAEQSRRRERRRASENAAPPAAATAAAAATAETAEPKLICKNIKPIGSRVARRICGTEEQWAADNARTSADAEESMRQMRSRSGLTTGGGSGPASLGTPTMGQ
jgi:hypothetical protein